MLDEVNQDDHLPGVERLIIRLVLYQMVYFNGIRLEKGVLIVFSPLRILQANLRKVQFLHTLKRRGHLKI